MQKRATRIITGSKNGDSFRDLIKKLKNITFSLTPIIYGRQKSMYNLNFDNHNINMSQKFNFTNIQQIYLYIKKKFAP
jgi:hypothetical protein